MKHMNGLMRVVACALLGSLLVACNGSVPQSGTPTPPAGTDIEGIATPSSVAVVTATNAN